MDYYTHACISLLFFVPALIGMARLRLAGYTSRLMTFIAWLLFASVLSELAAALSGYELPDIIFFANATLGGLLWVLQKRWQKDRDRGGFNWWGIGLSIVGLCRVFTSQWPRFSSILLIVLCTLTTFVLITMINQISVRHPFHLSRNPNFIIVLACLLHFLRVAWMESCWLFGINELEAVRHLMYSVSALIQLIILVLFCKGMVRHPITNPWKYLAP